MWPLHRTLAPAAGAPAPTPANPAGAWVWAHKLPLRSFVNMGMWSTALTLPGRLFGAQKPKERALEPLLYQRSAVLKWRQCGP